MVQDLKYTLRLWAARPCHTAFAIAALAIGIGANTGVFSVVNALLLRSLPFQQPERLALLRQFKFRPMIARRNFTTGATRVHISATLRCLRKAM